MPMMLCWSVLLWGGFCSGKLAAQKLDPVQAKSELKAYVEKMGNEQVSPEKGEHFFLHCRVQMVPRDSFNHAPQSSEFRYWLGKEEIRYESDRMQILGDKNLTATIIPHTRSIYLSEAPPQEDQLTRQGQQFAFQDTAWKYIEVVEVKSKCLANGRSGKLFTIGIASKAQASMGMCKASFLVDIEREQFVRVTTWHPAGHQLDRSTYEYLALEYDRPEPALGAPVKKLLFASRGKLNSDYSSYQVIELDKQ